VQTLTPLSKKANYDPANDFAVTGEQRGSYILERYLDINNPDFSPTTSGSTPAVDATTRALNEYYKFRVLRHSVFAPGS